jgi:hypothetical protein
VNNLFICIVPCILFYGKNILNHVAVFLTLLYMCCDICVTVCCTHRSVVIHITLHYHLIYASRSLCYSVFMHHIFCVANCYTYYAALPSDICTIILCCQPLYTSQRLCCHLLYTLCCVAICFMHYTLVCNHRLYSYHFLCFHLLLLHIMLHYHVICASHSFASLSFVRFTIVLSVVTI